MFILGFYFIFILLSLWLSSLPSIIKVKCSRYRPGVAQRVGRGIALLFHDRGTRRGWVVSNTPWPHFTPGKDPVPILQQSIIRQLIFKSPSFPFWIPKIAVCMSILWIYCWRVFHATLIRSHFHSLRLSWFSKPAAQNEGIRLDKSTLTTVTLTTRLTQFYLLVNWRDSTLS